MNCLPHHLGVLWPGVAFAEAASRRQVQQEPKNQEPNMLHRTMPGQQHLARAIPPAGIKFCEMN
jgi:hypothetical protein